MAWYLIKHRVNLPQYNISGR